MQSEPIENCPQCRDLIQSNAKRIIKDSCGHLKCRVCLLLDVDGCQQCLVTQKQETLHNAEVISSSLNSSFVENHHTTVITYSNVYTDTKKESNPLHEGNDIQVPSSINKLKRTLSGKTKVCDIEPKETVRKKVKLPSTKRKYQMISLPGHVSVKGEPPMFMCNICNSTFRTKGHVKYHKFCLEDKKPFSCDICSKTFILKSQLHIHKMIHLGSKPHVCIICSKAFRESGKLKRHMILHSDEKPHICDECGKRFKTFSSLKLHRLIHSGEKPFSCKNCKMKFSCSSNLKKHMVSHSDEKTHMCEQCGKKFKQKWALTVHRRSHLQAREFACKVCGRAFINSKDLKRHELVHSDSKIYSCSLCSMSFRRRDNLGRHIRNAHPDKNVKIIKKVIEQPEKTKPPVVDNPNAINVITASPIAKKIEDSNNKVVSLPRINGPLKLAVKSSAFKRNNNINRDYTFDSNSKGESSNKTIRNHSEDEQKPQPAETVSNSTPSIFPSLYSTPNISFDEFYANRPHVIKNIKFKIPEVYPSKNENLLRTLIPQTHVASNERSSKNSDVNKTIPPDVSKNADSKMIVNSNDGNLFSNRLNFYVENTHVVTPSVIVNSADQRTMHWRRRMSQNIASEKQ